MFEYEILIRNFAKGLRFDLPLETDTKIIHKLAVFDFDSTLFKSPLPNRKLWTKPLAGKIISDCQWFLEKRTLQFPYIPLIPGEEWWNMELVEEAKRLLECKDTLTILMTGRRKSMFDERICELCKQRNIPFNLILLKEQHQVPYPTMEFKQHVLEIILNEFKNISQIKLYDDRPQHVKLFRQLLEKWEQSNRINQFDVFLVEMKETDQMTMEEEMEKQLVKELVMNCNAKIKSCNDEKSGESNDPCSLLKLSDYSKEHSPSTPRLKRNSISIFRSKIHLIEMINYTAIFLNDESKKLLGTLYPCPLGWSKWTDHVTIALGEADANIISDLGGIGSEHTFFATHFGNYGGKVDALKIDYMLLTSNNETMHLTLHTAPNVAPKYANYISEWSELKTPILLGGQLNYATVTGLEREIHSSIQPKPVSIGNLVKKYHPLLAGKEIGLVVNYIHQWMDKTFVENLDSNRATIEWQIQNLDIDKIFKESAAIE
jgi:hypothetical protein